MAEIEEQHLTDEQWRLVTDNMGLVDSYMRKHLHGQGLEKLNIPEVRDALIDGLMNAAVTHDEGKGKFSTWAYRRMKWKAGELFKQINSKPDVAAYHKARGVASEVTARDETGLFWEDVMIDLNKTEATQRNKDIFISHYQYGASKQSLCEEYKLEDSTINKILQSVAVMLKPAFGAA